MYGYALHGVASGNYRDSLPFLHYSALAARAVISTLPHPATHPYLPPLLNGADGIVEGVSDAGDGLAVRFPVLYDVVLNIELKHVSREKPEPPNLTWLLGLLFCGIALCTALCIVLTVALLYLVDATWRAGVEGTFEGSANMWSASGTLSVIDSAELAPTKGTEISPSSIATRTFSAAESTATASDGKKNA